MKCLERVTLLGLASLVLVSGCFADDAKTAKGDDTTAKRAAPGTTESLASSTDAKANRDSADAKTAAALKPALPARVAAAAADANAAPTGDASYQAAEAYNATIKWNPMPALDGNPGLFTLETGDILPKGAFDVDMGANKFSRMPGDITSLQFIPSFGIGITNWLSGFFQINAYDHIHVGDPSLLSLSSVNALNPQYLNTIYPSIIPSTGFPPAYVEDAPFASHNGGGVGEIDLGFKIGVFSERKGKPLSLSIRNDFYIPTQTGYSSLLSNQVQYGKFNYGIGVEASKTILHHSLLATANWSYRFMRNSNFNVTSGGTTETLVLSLADQMQVGAGLIIFPTKRFQIMTEYDGLIFVHRGTQNTSFGARDPVDNVTGVRIYVWKHMAFDIGYRYNLNLNNHTDRNGFVIKLAGANWPEKPLPPDNVAASCAAEKSSVMEGSNDAVVFTATGTDANGHPLTYTWTANGGKVSGVGAYVRWDSAGTPAGNYTVTTRVDDGAGKSASCSANITVQPKPVPPAPTMSCAADRSSVMAGERPQITATVNDPSGLPLTYSWQTNGGQIVGTGSSVQLDTSGLQAGTYTVTGRAENTVHSACDCTTSVTVQAAPPPPSASIIAACRFKTNSSYADNVCQRMLDDAAVRLDSDPKAKVVLVGYADPKEARSDKLATARAANCQKYLVGKKRIDRSRVTTRNVTGTASAGDENRRTDVKLVPDGATE
jgi:outer membrane protein OmpA-like peptidoglycan-associated protein